MGHADEIAALARVANRLRARAGSSLPALFLFTDPVRTPCPVAAAARLPPGSAVVFRAFGAADAVETGRALRRACDARSLRLLVGVNERLALAVDADGLHLPEWAVSRLPALRRRRPRWLLTAAAHSLTAARRAATAGADGVVVSAVFPSESPSAGRPIGPLRLAGIARATPAPVIALGGVNGRSVRRLLSTGVAGVAAVGALA